MTYLVDVAIIGAGPAGCACAIELAKLNPKLKIALIDKASFPRDKICGDALSPDVINQLRKISSELYEKVRTHSHTQLIEGLTIISRKGGVFAYPYKSQKYLESYICPRKEFDNILWEYCQNYPNIYCYEGNEVLEIKKNENSISIQTTQNHFEASLIIGADSAHSIVGRYLGKIKMDREYHLGALRVYYEKVEGMESNFMELHFLKNLNPCYFWIFPLPNGQANVGLGMLSKDISEKKINLKETLKQLIHEHPSLVNRFKEAKALETVKGFGLPIGGKKNPISGERFLLLGDAASLIDPFTGEGIGNAIRSGRVAAEHIQQCFEKQDFSANMNLKYDKEIYRRMMPEFKANHLLKSLITHFPLSVDIFVWLSNRLSGMIDALMKFLLWIHQKTGEWLS